MKEQEKRNLMTYLSNLTTIRTVVLYLYYRTFLQKNYPGKIYVKDFLREIKMQGVKVGDADLENLCKITDKSGQVKLKLGNKG